MAVTQRKRIIVNLRYWSMALLAVASCANGGPVIGTEPRVGQGGASVAKPFWIREAELPEGFPAPGPVGKVMMKEYPSYRMARFVASPGLSGNQNGMFWPLFQHIKRNEIAMTAPVEMGYAADATDPSASPSTVKPKSMAFLYRRPTLGNTGADRADSRVIVEDVPAMTVLSVGIRGDYTEGRLVKALRQLEQWIAENPGRVEIVGEPRYLGYNSPMVVGFLRYGEVQLPIRHLAPSTQPASAARL